jgi:hypothetical protein
MASPVLTATAKRFLIFVVILDLALLAIVGAVCWFGGWHRAWDYGNGLTYAGLATIAVGALQFVGSFTREVDPIAGYHTTNLADQLGLVRRALGERDSTFANMLRLGVAGLLLLGIGQVLLAVIS